MENLTKVIIFLSKLDFQFWSGIASIIGLGVTLIGFKLTIANSKKAKSASEAAAEAANNSLQAVSLQNNIMTLMQLVKLGDELRMAIRVKNLEFIHDRCQQLRSGLIQQKAIRSFADENRLKTINTNITRISRIDLELNRDQQSPPEIKWALINSAAAKVLDDMNLMASETHETVKDTINVE